VGKSTLLGMIARNCEADINVIALIGERGREVQEFMERDLGPEGLARSVVVVATSDQPALQRIKAAWVATAIAEYFREEGLDVTLMMDSVTRWAMAQREIGLTVGEPPVVKGYPPSVFALMPKLLEKAGTSHRGTITGFYTVLVEGDDFNEPIPDAVKGITDGHLWLSRALANKGHFPAIDVLQSISRVRGDVMENHHVANAKKVLRLLALYAEIEDLVNIRAYVEGNIEFDTAIKSREKILQFLQQDAAVSSPLEMTKKHLSDLAQWIDQTEKALRAAQSQQQQRKAPTR